MKDEEVVQQPVVRKPRRMTAAWLRAHVEDTRNIVALGMAHLLASAHYLTYRPMLGIDWEVDRLVEVGRVREACRVIEKAIQAQAKIASSQETVQARTESLPSPPTSNRVPHSLPEQPVWKQRETWKRPETWKDLRSGDACLAEITSGAWYRTVIRKVVGRVAVVVGLQGDAVRIISLACLRIQPRQRRGPLIIIV